MVFFGPARVKIPARLAARIPFGESSIAIASDGAMPSRSSADRYKAGDGFARETSPSAHSMKSHASSSPRMDRPCVIQFVSSALTIATARPSCLALSGSPGHLVSDSPTGAAPAFSGGAAPPPVLDPPVDLHDVRAQRGGPRLRRSRSRERSPQRDSMSPNSAYVSCQDLKEASSESHSVPSKSRRKRLEQGTHQAVEDVRAPPIEAIDVPLDVHLDSGSYHPR